MGLDVHDRRFDLAEVERRFAHLDVFLPAGRQQNFDLFRIALRETLNLEVDGHLVERVRNVLIRLDGDLVFHLLVVEFSIHLDGLGDHRRSGNSDRRLFGRALRAAGHSLDRFTYTLDIANILLNDGIRRQRFHRISFDPITVTTIWKAQEALRR